MAKSKEADSLPPPALNLEGTGQPPAGEIIDRVPTPSSETPPPTEQFPGAVIQLSIPLHADDSTKFANLPWKIANLRLHKGERLTIVQLRQGLIHQRAKLANGRPIKSNQDALRWILQQLGNEPQTKRQTFKRATGA